MDEHIPVLFAESLEYLAIRPDGIYVDATFGAGGHSRGILKQLEWRPARCLRCGSVCGAARGADRRSALHLRSLQLSRALQRRWTCSDIGPVDGVLFDLGVSSMQFDDSVARLFVPRIAPRSTCG